MQTPATVAPPRHDPRSPSSTRKDSMNLVAVASEWNHANMHQPEPAVSFRLQGLGGNSCRVCYSRVAAGAVAGSAAWMLQRMGKGVSRHRQAGAILLSPGNVSELPRGTSEMIELLRQEEGMRSDHTSIAAAIVRLRAADAVLAGPFSTEDAGAPGLIPHLADLARRAYRACGRARSLLLTQGSASSPAGSTSSR